MDEKDRKEMELIAEIRVRRFFTHYLEEIFPRQLTATIAAHNVDVTAHHRQIQEAIKTESIRLRLWLIGMVFVGGLGGGVGIAKAVAFLTGS